MPTADQPRQPRPERVYSPVPTGPQPERVLVTKGQGHRYAMRGARAMLNGKRLIVYELNEVPIKIFNWFVQRNSNGSNVASLMRNGRIINTITEDSGHLSPWITWPTMHRGVTNANHGIFDFGQNLKFINQDYPPIWEFLAKGGLRVGMFGSLHTYPLPSDLDNYAFYVPDTFAAGPECFPDKFTAFQEFNLRMVDQSGRNVARD